MEHKLYVEETETVEEEYWIVPLMESLYVIQAFGNCVDDYAACEHL